MTLDKLVFEFKDIKLELTPKFEPGTGKFFLRLVPVKISFNNSGEIHERKGYLRYDVGKKIFITALTDYLFPGKDWSTYPSSDLERYFSYQQIINQTFRVLDILGLVREGECLEVQSSRTVGYLENGKK